ncbi:cell wall-binding repeat-containing protein [Peptostreptococcus faecalis]|uniref:cell wall-binding repeat-containing protein n=1 Tax=Peptostreptococcus faecalis TaxID=2045015 RepID=UPI000C7AEAEA|nr:cell wall-binding repeat-containing protein [Peptostreptococcus faecalis]
MKKIVSLCLGVMIFVSSLSISSASDLNVSRIAGADRYETAVLANKKYINKADGNLAVIASGQDFKTALYGSYMASALKVPFYVLPKNEGVSKAVLNEFDRLNIKRAYVMGDKGTLSAKVDNTLKARGVKVERIANGHSDFYNMEEQVNVIIREAFPLHGHYEYVEIIVNSDKTADLLSVAPFAAELSRTYGYWLKDYRNSSPDYRSSYKIGGGDSIPYNYSAYTMLFGDDRYETAYWIAEHYKKISGFTDITEYPDGSYSKTKMSDKNTVVIVGGDAYADSLPSSLVAAYNGGVILPTYKDSLNYYAKHFIQKHNIKKIIIVGGENSVSKNVENELRNL